MNTTIRITNNAQLAKMQGSQQNHQYNYATQQERISKGKQYLKRSDAPAETDMISRVKNANIKIDRWRTNAKRAKEWELATESKLQSILEDTQRVRELNVQANSDVTDDGSRVNIATEINGILEGLVQAGNATYLGTYMFAGTKTDTPPYVVTRDANGNIASATFLGAATPTPPGTETKRTYQSSEIVTDEEYGLTGNEIFDFEVEGNTHNLINELILLRDTLLAGDKPTNASVLEKSIDHVVTNVINNTAAQKKLDSFITNMNSMEQNGINKLGEIEGLDMAEAISNLSSLEMSYQASLQMIGRMNELSLMNYI